MLYDLKWGRLIDLLCLMKWEKYVLFHWIWLWNFLFWTMNMKYYVFMCGSGCVLFLTFVLCTPLNFNTGSVLSRAAEITTAKGGTLLQMKLAYDHLAPLFLLLLQWMDFSCTCFLLRYLDLFHIVVYKVSTAPILGMLNSIFTWLL